MSDSDFLHYLLATNKVHLESKHLYGAAYKIPNTCLTLSQQHRFIGGGGISEWSILTSKFFLVVKAAEYGTPLQELWSSIDISLADREGNRLDKWFSPLPAN